MQFVVYNPFHTPTEEKINALVDFLVESLGEYGDPAHQIRKCVGFALREYESFGGFVIEMRDDSGVLGVSVVNQTGMSEYVPENLLVYIAVRQNSRGLGLGSALLQETLNRAKGNLALHVEPDNPARRLYERNGFSSKYIEMRLYKEG